MAWPSVLYLQMPVDFFIRCIYFLTSTVHSILQCSFIFSPRHEFSGNVSYYLYPATNFLASQTFMRNLGWGLLSPKPLHSTQLQYMYHMDTPQSALFVLSSGFSGYHYSDIWVSRWQWTHSNHQRQLQLFWPSFSKELKLLACVPGPVSEMLWRYLWWLILNGNVTGFRITQKLHLRAVLVLPRLCFLTLQDLNKQRQNNIPQLWYKISPCSLKHFLIRLDVITIRKATLSQCPDSEIYSSLTTFLNTILCTFLWISCELYKLSILQFLIFLL